MLNLITKYLNNQADEAEKTQVENWRNENPSDFHEIKSVWAATDKQNSTSKKLGDIFNHEVGKSLKPKFKGWKYGIAAVISLVIVAASVWFFNRDNLPIGAGVAEIVKLKDGSKITLHQNAKIKYLTEDKRTMELTGKAYFEVKNSKNTPFIVYTEQAVVTVKGTVFQVIADGKGTTEVVVESGLVGFGNNPNTSKVKSPTIDLKIGEKGIISPMAKGIIKQNNRDENYAAWATKVLYFKNERLHRAADLIEEVYGYKISFSNRKIANCTITATYIRKNPTQLAKLISETFGFTYTISPDKKEIIFDGQSCL